MANITVNTGDYLQAGTAGDDAVTISDSVIGSSDTHIGNTIDPVTFAPNADAGVDTATLTMDTLGALAGAGVAYTAGTGWAVTGGDSFGASFSQLTTSDGEVLVGGVAWTEDKFVFDNTSITGPGTPGAVSSNAYVADILGIGGNNTTSVSWTGAALTSADIDMAATAPGAPGMWSITKFDGNLTSAGNVAIASDGFGQLTVTPAGTLEFTPDSAAIAGASNTLGETLTFTYEVEITDDSSPANVETLDITFSVIVDWTTGADVVDVSDATAAMTIAEGAGFTMPDGTVVAGSGLLGGADAIQGGGFNDILTGDAGSDTLKGGNGNDMLLDDNSVAGDSNFIGGGAGDDSIVSSSLAGDGDKLVGAGGMDVIEGGAGDDTVNSGGANDMVILDGTGLNATATAGLGGGNNSVRAGDGDDTVIGGSGDDTVKAGDGDDSVNGGAGNDVLFTSKGDMDTLTGGAGDDAFIIKAGTGHTVITDFDAPGSDELDVTALGWTEAMFNAGTIEYYLTEGDGTAPGAATVDTVIIVDADTTITLQNFQDLNANDFEFA